MYSFHYFEQFENKYHEINFLFAENFFFIKIDNFRKEREIHINISHLRSQMYFEKYRVILLCCYTEILP